MCFTSIKRTLALCASCQGPKRSLRLSAPLAFTNTGETAFQMTLLRCLLNLPFQLANKSTTLFGITQLTPNKERVSTQGSQAIERCNSKWSMDSPSCLHIQHQLTPHCCKISTLRIFLKAADQTKKATLSGSFTFHILFHGNSAAPSPCET